MLFQIDFYQSIQGKYITVHSAIVFADSVSECQTEADLIKKSLNDSNIKYAIEEFA